MLKRFGHVGLAVLSALAVAPGSSHAETIELVTYYPVPEIQEKVSRRWAEYGL